MTQEPSSPIPAEIAELITTHQLGRFRTRYTARTLPRGLFWSVVFTLLGLFFVVVSFFSFGTGSFFPALLVGLVLLSIGLILPIRHFLKRSWQVYLCKEGLISTRKGRTDVIRWDEVTAVQVGSGTSYTLRRADGKVLEFDNTLRDVKDLGEIIVKETTRYLLPQALTTYAAGSTVSFGELSVNQQGLLKDRQVLPWNQVESIRTALVGTGTSRYQALVIRQKGKHLKPWATIPVAAIPNYIVFLELTEHALKTSQKEASSSTAQRPNTDSSSDLTSTLAHLGVELDSGVSDPETALWGGIAKASLALAWDEYTAGKFDKVITDMTGLINDANLQDKPRFVSVRGAAYYVRGLAYEKQGNLTQASQDFESSGQLVPDYEPARQAWTRVHALSRHIWLESTLAQLGVVLEVRKSDPDAMVSIMAKTDLAFAWKEYSEGKFVDKSIESATRLINNTNLQDKPRFVSILAAAYYIRGLANEKQGNTAQAIHDFQSALQLVPDYELAKQALSLRGQ